MRPDHALRSVCHIALPPDAQEASTTGKSMNRSICRDRIRAEAKLTILEQTAEGGIIASKQELEPDWQMQGTESVLSARHLDFAEVAVPHRH